MKLLLVLSALLVAATGQTTKLTRPGIIVEPEIKQCEQELLRYQRWDSRMIYPQKRVQKLYNSYLRDMEKTFVKDHPELLMKMDNYSSYQSALPDIRGEGNFEDCSDLCPSVSVLVGALALKNISNDVYGNPKTEICFIYKPHLQNFRYQQCTTELAENVAYSNDFQMKYACVPDGFIRRKLIVYCPEAPMGQCKEVEFSVPMACSPKLAKCTYTDAYMVQKKAKENLERVQKAKNRNNYLGKLLKF